MRRQDRSTCDTSVVSSPQNCAFGRSASFSVLMIVCVTLTMDVAVLHHPHCVHDGSCNVVLRTIRDMRSQQGILIFDAILVRPFVDTWKIAFMQYHCLCECVYLLRCHGHADVALIIRGTPFLLPRCLCTTACLLLHRLCGRGSDNPSLRHATSMLVHDCVSTLVPSSCGFSVHNRRNPFHAA